MVLTTCRASVFMGGCKEKVNVWHYNWLGTSAAFVTLVVTWTQHKQVEMGAAGHSQHSKVSIMELNLNLWFYVLCLKKQCFFQFSYTLPLIISNIHDYGCKAGWLYRYFLVSMLLVIIRLLYKLIFKLSIMCWWLFMMMILSSVSFYALKYFILQSVQIAVSHVFVSSNDV